MARYGSDQVSIPAQIVGWSRERPAWQQEALRRLAIADPSELDLEFLAELCIAHRTEATPPPVEGLTLNHFPGEEPQGSARVIAIRNCLGLDALAPGKTLEFGEQGLNVVYGDNGAGKTSYARLLRQLGQGAGVAEVLVGDAFTADQGVQSAEVVYSVDGQRLTYNWIAGDTAPEPLRQIRVLTSSGVQAIVDSGSQVSYQPAGLHLLTHLASACIDINGRLQARVVSEEAEAAVAVEQLRPIAGDHEVGRLVARLGEDLVLERLSELAGLNDQETLDLQQAKKHLADLRPPDPSGAARVLRARASRIIALSERITQMHADLSDTALRTASELADRARSTRQNAEQAAEALAGNPLPGVGGEVWRAMWEAARAYSAALAYPGAEFPVTGLEALCVLCQQPLLETGRTRLLSFEEFVRTTIQADADNAMRVRLELRDRLDSLAVVREDDAVLLADPALSMGELSTAASEELTNLGLRRQRLLDLLATETEISPLPTVATASPLSADLAQRLRNTADALSSQAQQLEQPNDASDGVLLARIAELEARLKLKEVMDIVKMQDARLRRLTSLSRAREDCDTRRITIFQRELTDKVVTNELIARFDEERTRLGLDRLKVRMARSGRTGTTVCVIELREAVRPIPTQRVLSDGERRGISMAAFLAELTVIPDNVSLVIDDPVSSLDHHVRERLAQRLVEEATRRQVIVLTHDPVFLFLLYEAAGGGEPEEKQMCPVMLIEIERSSEGTGTPGELGALSAASPERRIGHLRDRLQNTKHLYSDHEDAKWGSVAIELAKGLRDAWERAVEERLLNAVVVRFRRSVETKRLGGVKFSNDDASTTAENMARLSQWVHDPARSLQPAVPTPDELTAAIDSLDEWLRIIKSR